MKFKKLTELIKYLYTVSTSENFRNKFDITLLIGINIFIPVFYCSFFFLMLMENMLIISLPFEGTITCPKNLIELGYYLEYFFLDFIYAIFVGLRFCILPVTYNFLEKKSKNDIVKNFIYKLKNNRKTRYIILFLTELLFVLFYIFFFFVVNNMPNLFVYIKYFKNIIVIHALFTLFADLFGCYLALFLWWKFKGELK